MGRTTKQLTRAPRSDLNLARCADTGRTSGADRPSVVLRWISCTALLRTFRAAEARRIAGGPVSSTDAPPETEPVPPGPGTDRLRYLGRGCTTYTFLLDIRPSSLSSSIALVGSQRRDTDDGGTPTMIQTRNRNPFKYEPEADEYHPKVCQAWFGRRTVRIWRPFFPGCCQFLTRILIGYYFD